MPFLAPVFGVVASFAGTWIGQAVISVAISFGLSLLKQAMKPKTPDQRPPGFKLSVEFGDTLPMSFTVGYAGTAGSRKYIGTWGNSGDTPNAYLTEVLQVGDLPVPGLDGFWANKQRCTIATTGLTDKGYPVTQFRRGGVDHMWVKFRTGAETTADALLVAKFGSHPSRPWTSDYIGRGAPHAIVTTLVNRDLFPNGKPEFMFEPKPMVFYDLRKDTTNGGSGAHRWNDPTTWEQTRNPAVIIYNIIRGIKYGSEWFYGGRDLPAFRLPFAMWSAAANECDAPISLAGGGTEPQFRCGMEITVDTEPLAVIEELLKSCSGRLSEIGGIWEILVGAPGAAVYSFTDDDILVTRGQSYKPFPGLQATFNGIEATYPNPAEMWRSKDAPARYNTDWESEDGERRLATGVSFTTVPYALQCQRVMETMIRDERRFRVHSFFLPPDAWPLTGTCVVSWTSTRNGYVNKKFLVSAAEGEPSMMQQIVLKETDPSDYSWSTDMELPTSDGGLDIVRPAAQPMTGWSALPAAFLDDNGVQRRATIQVTFASGLADVRAVRIQVRNKLTGDLVFDGETPYQGPFSVLINATFIPDTEYEVRGKFLPFTIRDTLWSNEDIVAGEIVEGDWITVLTLDISEDIPPIDVGMLGQELTNIYGLINGNDIGSVSDRLLQLQALVETLANAVVTGDETSKQKISVLQANQGTALAAVIRNEQAIVTIDSALASLSEEIVTVVDQVLASGLLKIEGQVVDAGAKASILLKVRAAIDLNFSEAALRLRAVADGVGGTISSVEIMADRLVFISTTGVVIQSPFSIINNEVITNVVKFKKLLSLDGTTVQINESGSFSFGAVS